MTVDEIKKVNIDDLLLRFENLSAQKTQGYSTGLQFFIDTVNNQVIPEMNMIVGEIRSRVKN